MRRKLIRVGNSLALVLDKRLLDRVGIDARTLLDISTNGQVIVVSPVRDRRRTTKLRRIVAEAHNRYAGVFRRLAPASDVSSSTSKRSPASFNS